MAAELCVGVSASDSADLGRLGLTDRHLRLAVGEVARVVLRAGHTLVYGGHLRPGGFTVFLESEIDRYGGPGKLRLFLPWSEHRSMTLQELRDHEAYASVAQITYLDADGWDTEFEAGRGEDAVEVDDIASALTGLRRRLVRETHARVLIGGRVHGYLGEMPGIVQEAALAIEAGQPLYLAGGFGGATAAIAAHVAGLDETWLPPAEVDLDPVARAIERVGWELAGNGLTAEQNRRLACTHRPSDVATLIAVGLSHAAG